MYYAGSELAVRSVQKRTQHGHQEDKSPPAKALGKGLSVPREECHWPDDGQVEKAALNPPVNGGGRTGIVGYRFQLLLIPLTDGGLNVQANLYCKQSEQRSEAEPR